MFSHLTPGPSPKERGDSLPFGEGWGGVLGRTSQPCSQEGNTMPADERIPLLEGQGVGKNACLIEKFQKVAHRVKSCFGKISVTGHSYPGQRCPDMAVRDTSVIFRFYKRGNL